MEVEEDEEDNVDKDEDEDGDDARVRDIDKVACRAAAAWWRRTVYDGTPRFLEDMEAEAKKAAPAAQDAGGAFAEGALMALAPEERLVAIQERPGAAAGGRPVASSALC